MERHSREEMEYALTTLGFFRGDVKKTAAFLQMAPALLDRWRREAERSESGPSEARIFAPGARPVPAAEVIDPQSGEVVFAAAGDVCEWARAAFMAENSPLYNSEHDHLVEAHVGVLWTNAPNAKNGNRVVGTAEIPTVNGSKWLKLRMEWQLRQWFGAVPDFLITLDAVYAAAASDALFCALVEHELLHCGQAKDEFGQPRFTREGAPVLTIRGHDCEEFVSIVARYGAGNAAGSTLALVEAARRGPAIAEADIARMCGTCVRA